MCLQGKFSIEVGWEGPYPLPSGSTAADHHEVEVGEAESKWADVDAQQAEEGELNSGSVMRPLFAA